MRGRGCPMKVVLIHPVCQVFKCLPQGSISSSSAQDPSNLHSGPVVVCPDQQLHVSPPPPMQFDDSRPRHLDMFLHSRVCDFPGPGVSLAVHPGVLPVSDQKAMILSAFACTPCPRISSSRLSSCGAVAASVAVAVAAPSSRRGSRGGPDTPKSISTSKFHFVPRASTLSRRLHFSPGGFLKTDLHYKHKPNHASSRRGVHPTKHLVSTSNH